MLKHFIPKINNEFDFGDAQAKEVMVPRIDMTIANIDCTYDALIEIFKEDKFTRLPVYKETTDNVIGIINMKDLLLYKDREHFSIQDIMREPYFTYEHKNTAELFMEMRKSSISLAIVLDEYGTTAGLLTLEDLIEEILGDIDDEHDTTSIVAKHGVPPSISLARSRSPAHVPYTGRPAAIFARSGS